MTPEEISAVATTIAMIKKSPPNGESWSHPGNATLADTVQKWLKEKL